MTEKEVIVNWIGYACNYTTTYEVVVRNIDRVVGYVVKTEDLL